MLKKGIILLALLFISSSAFAFQLPLLQQLDTLTYRQWTLEDGLPVNTVNSIGQDNMGHLWLTTYDGLVRFDGLSFKVFNYFNTPEMPHNRATMVHAQENGRIWVTLEYGGVLLLENEEFHHFGVDNGFTNSDVTRIFEASDGRMFFITHIGLFVYDEGAFSKFFEEIKPRQNQMFNIIEDEDKTFWISTNNGLINLRENEAKQYHISSKQEENRIFNVQQTDDGKIVAGTIQGYYELVNGELVSPQKYDLLKDQHIRYIYQDEDITLFSAPGAVFAEENGKVRQLDASSMKPTENIEDFYRDTDGVLWLIGDAGTLNILKDGGLEKFSAIEEIQDYYFNLVYEDREGNIWLCSNKNGLISINKSRVRTIGEAEGLSGDNILALFEDSENRYWVGTRGHGLNVLDKNEISTFLRENDTGIASNIVHSINEDQDGNIWVGYYQNGVDRIRGSTIKNYRIGTTVETNDVRSVFIDSNEKMWLGTYGGLVEFDPVNEDHKTYDQEDGMAGYKIRYIAEHPDGALWLATLNGGVSRFKDGSFTNYTTEQGLSSNNIRSIHIDEKDSSTIWIGTENNGLNRLQDGEITFVNRDGGLPDHIIHWISQDENGWLWTSSNRGVFKIDKAQLNQYLDGKIDDFTLLHYGRAEGMRNPEGNGAFQEAGLRTENGNFWFATQEGAAIFAADPEQVNEVPPTVLINNIEAGGKTYSPEEVNIESGFKNFVVNFHALTFIASEKTRFKYRLAGFEKEWTEVFGERSASYINVPAGEYTFEVIAANNDGVWSEKPAIASIIVQPFFYEEIWFYTLVILVLGLGYYGASQIRYRYLLRKQLKLEHIIEEQTAQLRKEKQEIEEQNNVISKQAEELEESNRTKDKFFSLIAHDLRNPFQGLVGVTELILMDMGEKENSELKENIHHLHATASLLHNFVEDLLSWASLQNGKMTPKLEEIDISKLAAELVKLLKDSAEQKNIELSFGTSVRTNVFADRNMLKTIIRNLISNAIKFTDSGGAITLEFSQDDLFHVIKVKDDGVGMEKDMVEKLLQIDSNESRRGTNNEKGSGLGLLICKEMIALHGGKLAIESEVGKGSTFIVKLPQKINNRLNKQF